MAAAVSVAALLCATAVQAQAWPSVMDDRYRERDVRLYQQYQQARSLLDQYAGESAFLDLASTRLQFVLSKDEGFAPAYVQVGRWLIMSNDGASGSTSGYLLAGPAVRKALELEPDYADAWVLLGHIHTNLGDYAKAEEALDRARTIGTQNPWLNLNAADNYLQMKKPEKAFAELEALRARDVDNIKARRAMPDLYVDYYRLKGDLQGMETWYRRDVEENSDSAWSHGNYASFLLWRKGDFAEAERRARDALERMNYGRARFTLAGSLYAQWASAPTAPEARARFDEATSLYPDIEAMAAEFEEKSATRTLAPTLRQRAPARSAPDSI